MTASRAAKAAIITLSASLVLVGCGRKGPLDVPPPRGAAQTEDEKQEEQTGKRRFILDPLIE